MAPRIKVKNPASSLSGPNVAAGKRHLRMVPDLAPVRDVEIQSEARRPVAEGQAVPSPSADRMDAIGPLCSVVREMRKQGLSATVFHALLVLHLSRNRECNLRQISRVLGTTSAAMTSVADKLEALGLAKRMFHDTDRRQHPIIVTARGNALLDRMSDLVTGTLRAPGEAEPTVP